jgi:hypothetical protein
MLLLLATDQDQSRLYIYYICANGYKGAVVAIISAFIHIHPAPFICMQENNGLYYIYSICTNIYIRRNHLWLKAKSILLHMDVCQTRHVTSYIIGLE